MKKPRSRKHMDTLEKLQICKIDRERKGAQKLKCLSPNEKQNFRDNPNYYKIKKKSDEVLDLLGSDPEMFSDVLSHVIFKSSKSPVKIDLLQKKLKPLLWPDMQSPKSQKTPTETAQINKDFRKIVLLCNRKKHEKAKQLSEELKSQFSAVKEIAQATGEHERFVYRALSGPKKMYTMSLHQETG